MRHVIVGNFICAMLCASLATSSNISKRSSSPYSQVNWKKRLLFEFSQESASHQYETSFSTKLVDSLQLKETNSLFLKNTTTANSITGIQNLPMNENGSNLINTTPSSSIELISDTELEESLVSGINSSQPITSKDCLNDAVYLSVSIQTKSSLPHQSVSVGQKLQSRERKDSKCTPNSIIKRNSNNSFDQKSNETKFTLSKGNSFVLDFSHGTLYWSKNDTVPKSFRTIFCFRGRSFSLNFDSDNLINLFFFKYAANTFNLFTKYKRVLNGEYKLGAIKSVYAIFSTITSLPPHLIPHYYSFSRYHCNHNRYAMDFIRIPLYFLFTTISYLMKNEQDENIPYLGPLLKEAYQRILDCNKLNTSNWIFLKDFLSQYFDTSDLNFKTKYNGNYVQFDNTAVSFIYHEMRFGASEKVKLFFTQVWKTSEKKCNRRNNSITISNSPKISIPSKTDKCPNIFEREMRKLYQMEFTNMLFKRWNRMEDLLEEFTQLKIYFSTINNDFRLRAFCSNDFELLSNALRHIYSLLEGFSYNEKSPVRLFLVELEYFINFKCFIFIFDFCNELEKKTINGSLYQKTFEFIESILISFERIRSIGSKYFQLNPINLDILRENPDIQSLSLTALTDKCLQFIESIDFGLFNESKAEFDEFLIHLNNYAYFAKKFNSYFTINLYRFKCVELIDELNEILESNNEKKFALVFSDEKYKFLREFWKFKPKELNGKSCMEGRRLFLEQFKAYLVLHSQ